MFESFMIKWPTCDNLLWRTFCSYAWTQCVKSHLINYQEKKSGLHIRTYLESSSLFGMFTCRISSINECFCDKLILSWLLSIIQKHNKNKVIFLILWTKSEMNLQWNIKKLQIPGMISPWNHAPNIFCFKRKKWEESWEMQGCP